MFEDGRHERSPILLLSKTDPDILKKSKLTDDEINIIKNLALEKLRRQRILKEYAARSLLEEQFFDYSMTNYHNINDVETLKIETRDDEIKNSKYQTQTHDHEKMLKSLKIDNEYCMKKYKSLR